MQRKEIMSGAAREGSQHFTKNHYNEAFRTMAQMRADSVLCDVTLKAGKTSISAHKLVLAATSPYFNAMFTSEMLERSSQEIELHEIDEQALSQLVEYAYTSHITINEHNVQVLLPAACLLQMNTVREASCKYLMKQLEPANCLGIRRFADTHACDDLLRLSHQYVLQNFTDVCDSEEFLLLSFQDLKELLASEDLYVPNEQMVFNSVIRWIKHDLTNRQDSADELLSLVKMPLLPRDFLLRHVEQEPLVTESSACKDLLIEAMKYHLMPEHRISMSSQRTLPRQSKARRPTIYAVGGGSLFAIHSECESYDPACDLWVSIAPLLTRRSRCGVTAAQGHLYAIGGYDGTQDLNTAEAYNPRANVWAQIAPMGTKRSCLGVCEWNGLLYAVGGYDGASCLNSVERYDPLTLTWTSVMAMNLRRRYLKCVVVDNCIVAVGGFDGSAHMSSVEKFDPQTNKWTPSPNMICRRSNMGIGILDGMVYVCGGTDGASCLMSVERFNPRRNLWEAVSPMNSRRSTHDVVVVDNMMYAVGGNDGSTSLNSIECYNPKSNKWTIVAPMNLRRSCVGAAILETVNTKSFSWYQPDVYRVSSKVSDTFGKSSERHGVEQMLSKSD